jgi:MYXO-CTERM domain-containing protein
MLRSVDGGMTWEDHEIEGSANDSGPYLAAVDPSSPDAIYVRLNGKATKILRSTDGGLSFTEVFQGTGRLAGFALSPDGTELRVGGEDDGVFAAKVADLETANPPSSAFANVSNLHARCLTWTDQYLYACAREALDGFTIGTSTDGGKTWAPIHHIECLSGPDPSCGADTDVGTECPGPWAAQKQLLQTDTCEDPSSVTTGSSATGSGAGGGEDGAADGGGGGCSCVVPSGEADSNTRIWAIAAALGWAGLVASRRRRSLG